MKDALGHGSSPRGSHATKIDNLPGRIPLRSLLLSEHGLAIARASWNWGQQPKISDAPIKVSISPKGENYLLDGYHRVVDAQKRGANELDFERVPWSRPIAKRYREDRFARTKE